LKLCRYVERQWLNKSSIGAARMSVRGNPARTNNAVESFQSALRRRVKVAHPNLYTFLGHLQRATADSETEIARLNRYMSIRRCKKRTNLVNDARIKSCIARYDSGAYTRAYTRPTDFSRIFHPCKLVPHFHVPQFPPVQTGAANSCLAFSVAPF